MPCLKRFLKDERGAVTVDWVVLTAGIVVLGLIAVVPIKNVLEETASGIGDTIAKAETFMD
jgi:Flp pilus assembly pilin Flp